MFNWILKLLFYDCCCCCPVSVASFWTTYFGKVKKNEERKERNEKENEKEKRNETLWSIGTGSTHRFTVEFMTSSKRRFKTLLIGILKLLKFIIIIQFWNRNKGILLFVINKSPKMNSDIFNINLNLLVSCFAKGTQSYAFNKCLKWIV